MVPIKDEGSASHPENTTSTGAVHATVHDAVAAAAATVTGDSAIANADDAANLTSAATAVDESTHPVAAVALAAGMADAMAAPASAKPQQQQQQLQQPAMSPPVMTTVTATPSAMNNTSSSGGMMGGSLSGVAAATAAIGVTKHCWGDGTYRRVPNDYRLETTVSPLEAWQRWHLGEILTSIDPNLDTVTNIVIPPWKTLGSADLKGHSKYSTNTTNQDIKNVRLICRAFDAAAGLTVDSNPSAEELESLYETNKIKNELPPNETPKGRKREVAQLSWLTCAKDKRRRTSLENPAKRRHPGGRPKKHPSMVSSASPSMSRRHDDGDNGDDDYMPSSMMGEDIPTSTPNSKSGHHNHNHEPSNHKSPDYPGQQQQQQHQHHSDSGGLGSDAITNPTHSSPAGVGGNSGNKPNSNSNHTNDNNNATRNANNSPHAHAHTRTPEKSIALMQAEEEIAQQKSIQERQKTVFELLKSRAELEKLGVSEEHVNKYFPLPMAASEEV